MARQGIIFSFGDTLTHTGSAVQGYPLGTIRNEESATSGRGCEIYRYVYQNEATVTPVAGNIAYGGNTLGNIWEVGMDVSDVDPAFAVGVYQSVLTNATYGWVKTRGYEASLKKANGTALNWVKGDVLIASAAASQDGMAQNWEATGTNSVVEADVQKLMERPIGWAASTALSTTARGKAYIQFE